MQKSSYEFDVLVHGSSAKEYYHNGSYYIEGKEGSHFSIRMRNNSNHRVLFVPTVDGLSIMSGKEASFKSSGYIVGAYDSLTISGWRTSNDNVAEFFFSTSKQSYASKMDRAGNLGVIGCAVFKEKERVQVIEKTVIQKEYIPYPVYPHHHCHPFCTCTFNTSGTNTHTFNTVSLNNISGLSVTNNSSSNSVLSMSAATGTNTSGTANLKASKLESGLGTGFGEDKYSPVVTVEFDKEATPSETFSIFYNTRKNLEALGIEFRKPVYVAPSAFPKEDGYCERPRD